jgi:AAA15 family ATPase/GTPase
MVAGASAARRLQHSLETGNSYAPHVLRSACIFGPNGAGKTSLVRALSFFRRFVISSAKDHTEGDEIDVRPFKGDPEYSDDISEFEIIFIFRGVMYQYGFTADRKIVHEEWLFARSNEANSRIRTVFRRAFDKEISEYVWDLNDDILKGEREVWRKSTRENALFFSTAVQLNSSYLAMPFQWFDDYLRLVSSPERLNVRTTVRWARDEKRKADVIRLLRSFDLPIVDFDAEEREIKVSGNLEKIFSSEFLESLKDSPDSREYNVQTYHSSRGRTIKFSLKDESDGTRVLFSLAGPLLETTGEGYTLIVDELHNSLHPLALRYLVELFHDPEVNRAGAQLIFTSHDTAVMAKGFMHRDQIWLVERSEEGGTELIPLSDFPVREAQSFQRAYLGGKYGALPRIGSYRFGQE